MIDFYNQELNRLKNEELTVNNIDKFINRDKKKIKWTRKIKKYFTDSTLDKFRNHYQNNPLSPKKEKEPEKFKNWQAKKHLLLSPSTLKGKKPEDLQNRHPHESQLLKPEKTSYGPNLSIDRESILMTGGSIDFDKLISS